MNEQSATTATDKIIAVLVIVFILAILGHLTLNQGGFSDNDSPFAEDVPRDNSISAQFDEVETDEVGYAIVDLVEGEGEEVVATDTVTLHFVGTLDNGFVFSSSRVNNSVFNVILGEGNAIEGFERALVGMKVGGKRVVRIPPALGYGDQEVPGIPAGSVIYYEIELLSIDQ